MCWPAGRSRQKNEISGRTETFGTRAEECFALYDAQLEGAPIRIHGDASPVEDGCWRHMLENAIATARRQIGLRNGARTKVPLEWSRQGQRSWPAQGEFRTVFTALLSPRGDRNRAGKAGCSWCGRSRDATAAPPVCAAMRSGRGLLHHNVGRA